VIFDLSQINILNMINLNYELVIFFFMYVRVFIMITKVVVVKLSINTKMG